MCYNFYPGRWCTHGRTEAPGQVPRRDTNIEPAVYPHRGGRSPSKIYESSRIIFPEKARCVTIFTPAAAAHTESTILMAVGPTQIVDSTKIAPQKGDSLSMECCLA